VTVPGTGDAARPSAPAPEARWPDTLDLLVRGAAHSISNRVGTLGALAEALAASDPSGPFPPVLAEEVRRLEETLAVLRLLPRDEGRGAEPVRPADLVADAARLLDLHPHGRDGRVAVEGGEAALPVRVHPPSAVHALLLLMVEAAGEEGAAVTVAIEGEGDDDEVRVRVRGRSPDPAAMAAAVTAAGRMVSPCGGRVAAAGDGAAVVSLPTLRAARRREGQGGR
jgi:hypothetical protein